LTAEPGLTKSLQYTESLAAAVGDTTKSALEYPLVIKTPKRLNTTETDFGALKKLVDKRIVITLVAPLAPLPFRKNFRRLTDRGIYYSVSHNFFGNKPTPRYKRLRVRSGQTVYLIILTIENLSYFPFVSSVLLLAKCIEG
jgi:hypothetical protein